MEGKKLDAEFTARVEELPNVKAFIDRCFIETGCSRSIMKSILVSVEEVFVNIASYAYAPGTGSVRICFELTDPPPAARITFFDRGIPYDPLAHDDPDLMLSVEDRPIGGLGIFITKMSMDSLSYRYEDQQNILSMSKKL